MSYTLFQALCCVGLFAGMLILLKVGRRLGRVRLAKDPEGWRAGSGALEGGILALLGLMLAFTIAGAGARMDSRRRLMVDEANAIGTAYLRLDVLPAEAQPPLRELFRKYVDARLNVYRQLPDVAAAFAAIPASIEIQEEIWRQAVSAAKASPGSNIILLPALNAMIDISNTQTMEAQLHTHIMIFVILFVVALISALLSGYGMAASQSTNWIYMICFAAIVAITVYVIIDIEYPRLGLVRIDSFDQALVDVLKSMK